MRGHLWFIYALLDPSSKQVRYVGWTFDVRKRVRAHINTARVTRSHKANWIKSLLAANLKPEHVVLESGSGDWQSAERKWIEHFRNVGAPLTNMTSGGEGTTGCYPSEETRRKMSAARIGKKQPPEAVAKTRAALLGRKQAPEHLAQLSKVRKGKTPTIATAAAAKANTGRKQSDEWIRKRTSSPRPRPESRRFTPEQIRAIRTSPLSLRAAAKQFGVGQTIIHGIRNRTKYRDVT